MSLAVRTIVLLFPLYCCRAMAAHLPHLWCWTHVKRKCANSGAIPTTEYVLSPTSWLQGLIPEERFQRDLSEMPHLFGSSATVCLQALFCAYLEVLDETVTLGSIAWIV